MESKSKNCSNFYRNCDDDYDYCCSCCTGLRGGVDPKGENGQKGDKGDKGSIAATIPFSTTGNNYGVLVATDNQGEPAIINFIGFGHSESSAISLEPGEWNIGNIEIDSSTAYPTSFIVPYDATLHNICIIR